MTSFRFNAFVENTNQVTEDHNNQFKKHQDDIDTLNKVQQDFKAEMNDRMQSVHNRIDEVAATFDKNLKDTDADICRKMDQAEAESMRRHEKVQEHLGDHDNELKDLDRRSTKSENNIQNNRESIEKNKEEMETSFSEVAEKQRQNEQTHANIRQDLATFQTETKETFDSVHARLEHIQQELEKNDKDHESFVHEMNLTKVNLTNYQDKTRTELDSIIKNHEDLKQSHEGLTDEVEEHAKQVTIYHGHYYLLWSQNLVFIKVFVC